MDAKTLKEREFFILQVFISYSRKELDISRRVRAMVQQMGHKPWLDEENIQPGDEWDKSIDRAIKSSDVVLGVLTPYSIESKPVLNEWGFAQANDIPLILLRFKVIPDTDIPHRYIRLQYIDFTAGEDRAYKKLEEALNDISQVAREQFSYEQPQEQEYENDQKLVDRRRLKRLMSVPVKMPGARSFFIDQLGWLWISDHQQVRRFQMISRQEADSAWVLPKRNWKLFEPDPKHLALLGTDWDGNLVRVEARQRSHEQFIREGQYRDGPIHRLAIGADGWLYAANWNGEILSWDADGYPVLAKKPVKIPYLPISLCPLPDHSVGVADQAGHLRLLTSGGEQIWDWAPGGMINHTWVDTDPDGQMAFFAVVNQQYVVKSSPRQTKTETIKLDRPVLDLSHRVRQGFDGWTVILTKGGIVEWVSWSPFSLVASNRVGLGFEARTIRAVFDPQHAYALCALGLANSGQLFSLSGQECRVFSTPVIEKLILDQTERFMYWLLPDRIEMYRNPVVAPYPCDVKLIMVEGELGVASYHELAITLENTGATPICKISGQLHGGNRIDPSSYKEEVRFLPGETITLKFAVKSHVTGTSVPLELYLELEDEAGPPAWPVSLKCSVKSK